jgi:NAD(P) transhydrogenase subunit alpha
MTIGILKERSPENRVAVTPDSAAMLVKKNIEVIIERGAGLQSFFSDASYEDAGVLLASRMEVYMQADCILTIDSPTPDEISVWHTDKILVGGLNPYNAKQLIDTLTARNITSFSLDLLPRTTLAQSMDVLSSMATISGYKAVLEAASLLPRFFPMFITAAGTIRPAKMLVLGAGVAGLQALATARRLGAVVDVFDVRSAVKEEVHSLGGKFIEVEGAREDAKAGGYAIEQSPEFILKQHELIHRYALKANVIICTAQIPGKKAPILITKETVEGMEAGSVIIDLASSSGGNCELTKNNDIIRHHGIAIAGRPDYPSDMPLDSSRMYSNNMFAFARLLFDDGGNFNPDWNNEILKKSCLTYQGKLVHDKILQFYHV